MTMGDGVTFSTPPLEHDTEITGPSALKLFVSSATSDADLFVVLRVFDPQGKEVVFQGALDPHTPVAQGWLRASHRKLDPEAVAAVPAVSHARRRPAAQAGRSLRARHRNLADVHRRAEGLPHRADRSRQGLRVRRRGGHAFEHEKPDARLRAVRARRSDRPPARDFRSQVTLHFGAKRPAACCCRLYRQIARDPLNALS